MKKAHITLSGLIGMGPESWMGEPFFTADDVRRQINDNPSATQLIIHLTTRGGSVDEAFNIHELLTNSGKKITVIAEGQVASAGTIILLAGSVRQITQYGELMIHNPWGGVQGDADALQKAADEMQRTEDRIAQFYADKTGHSAATFDTWMKEEKYMNAEQALQLGFVTEILEPIKAVALLHNQSKNSFDMKTVLETLKESFSSFKTEVKAMIAGTGATATVPKALDLTLADGRKIHIETEADSYKEGDIVNIDGKAADDGDYTFPDGTIINVTGSKIDKVTTKQADPTEDPAVTALKAENATLKAELKTQETAMAEIMNSMNAYKNELAPSIKALQDENAEMKTALGSNYKPKGRVTNFNRGKVENVEENRAAAGEDRRKQYKAQKPAI